MDLITVDTETFYDKGYSLSSMTTEEYIRSPQFEVIGISVKVNNGPTEWYSGPDVAGFLSKFDFSNSAVLAHNVAFDGSILAWHYKIKPKMWFDTMSMARPKYGNTIGVSLKALAKELGLGEKGTEVVQAKGKRRRDFTPQELKAYGAYCVNDTELCHGIFRKLRNKFPVEELMIIDTVVRMFTEPSLVMDAPLLDHHLHNIIHKKNTLLNRIAQGSITGTTSAILGQPMDVDPTKALMSNDKLAAILTALGVEPPTKVSPTTGKRSWAFAKTDKEFTDLQEHENIHVQNVVSARLGVKSTLEETRTQSFLGVSRRGPLPILLNYYGAHTGRFSGGDKMNLQNLPRGGMLRRAMKSPAGFVIITCDSSQIEARVVAYLAGQDDLTQAFREGRDIYSEFACDIYGRLVTKSDKLERFVGKTSILGLGYGMGPDKFRATLALGQGGIKVDIDEAEAKRIVYLYRSKNWRIKQLWQMAEVILRDMALGKSGIFAPDTMALPYGPEGILLPNGLLLTYTNLRATTSGFVYDTRKGPNHIYGGKVVENVVQALARIVVARQMMEIATRYKVVLQVHDENAFIAPEQEAEEAMAFAVMAMSRAPDFAPDLPVACEAGYGYSYGDAK